MLGRRRRSQGPRAARPERTPRPTPPEDEGGAAERPEDLIDLIGELLRLWAEFPIGTDATGEEVVREQFEGWARHALVAAPPPGREPGEGEPSTPVRRDWPSLRRFVRSHREAEVDYVDRNLTDLREVVWIFIQSLGRSISEERKSDGRMSGQLERLREAVDCSDAARLKQEAMRSVTLIEGLMGARSARLQKQVQTLSGRLDMVSVELVDVRRKLATDALTKVHTRGALDDELARVVNLGLVTGSGATAIMVDVDHFKWVNDKYGHEAGDRVLVGIAECLDRDFRRAGDFVARYGGDEFMVLVRETDPDLVSQMCERAVGSVRDLEIEGGGDEPIRISVSVGAAARQPDDDVKLWLKRADRALYDAKEAGRDRFAVAGEQAGQGPARSEP